MIQRVKNKSGVLLLEAIFAIVILIVTLSVIIESLVSGLRSSVLAADYSKALILTDNVMAEVLAARTVEPAQSDFPDPNQQYRYDLTSETISHESISDKLIQAHLTVSWDSGRRQHDVSLLTWVPGKEDQTAAAP